MGAADLCSLVVVTAVDEARTGFLDELGASLCAQDVPDGWSVVWSVRFDGDRSRDVAGTWAPRLAAPPSGDALSQVLVGANGVRRGTATTRTMALYAAPPADWVLSVDADDLLAPGALAALCQAAGTAGTSWVSGTSVRFGTSADGTTWSEPRPDAFGPGVLPAGQVVASAVAGDLAPVTPNTILYRAPLVEALGGWPASVSAEDLGLLYTVSELADGWRVAAPVLLRRRWDGQVTAGSDRWHTDEHDLFVQAALRRARAARAMLRLA